MTIYGLDKETLPAGESLGLQASGLPSGAQHVPVTAPCVDIKLHAFPLPTVLHAANASGGGLCGPPLPSVGGADSAQQALNANVQTARPIARPTGLVNMQLVFMESLRVERQAPALPRAPLLKINVVKIWANLHNFPAIAWPNRHPNANSPCPYPSTSVAVGRAADGAVHGRFECLESAQRFF